MTRQIIFKILLFAIFLILFLPLVSISYSVLENDDQSRHGALALYIGTGLVCSVALAGIIVLEILSRKKN
jgi:hypothetical protein